MLSGNRNFEGRINPDVRANYLASPPLVVAYALAGRIDIDLTSEPLGTGSDGEPVYLRDIWPTPGGDRRGACARRCASEMFRRQYADVFTGDERWRALPVPEGDTYAWDAGLDLRRASRPTSTACRASRRRSRDIAGARVLALLGDSITTDHISPAGSIKTREPGRAAT